jgi:penicillin-binding protein 2
MAGTAESVGGAIVAMDVRGGAIRAAASAPAFDPNVFAGGDSKKIEALLTDKSHPLLNRVCNMALPPGSTFKTVTAAALLASATIGPEEKFFCRGYLHQPDRQRCEIYIRQNVGHGEVTLADALCRSCNVFFFHFAGQMGPKPLVDWAERFGFGRPTGIDLPGEASGSLPSPENIGRLEGHAWHTVDTQSMAVGQGSLTATPLQVLCMMAIVANGGRLVQPHVVEAENSPLSTLHSPLSRPLSLSSNTLSTIREGLQRVVADSQGTAHGTVYLESIAIAGKTGTAETGDDHAGHAWFAGYVPAEHPTMAFVIVLEHAGDAATTAGPLAKRLVLRMEQLGML